MSFPKTIAKEFISTFCASFAGHAGQYIADKIFGQHDTTTTDPSSDRDSEDAKSEDPKAENPEAGVPKES